MINTVYELETSLLRARRRREELKEALSQARFALREARTAEVEYSGITAFFDKLSGKYADKAETLSRQVRTAEAALNALLRQKDEKPEEYQEFYKFAEEVKAKVKEEYAAYEAAEAAEAGTDGE